MKKEFSFGGVKSGQIFQMGLVVPDADASMRFYAETMGVGPFTCKRGFKAPDGWYRGKSDMPELTLAMAYSGQVVIEVIQQHDDTPSVYKEFIDKHGYGLHHFGVAVAGEEYDKTLKEYHDIGFEDVFTDTLPSGARIYYISPKADAARTAFRNESGVGYLELVEIIDSEQSFLKSVYDSAANWDGKTVVRA